MTRVGLYDLLPLLLRLRDREASGATGEDPILQRITEAVQGEYDAIEALIVGIRETLDPTQCPEAFLPLIARLLGLVDYPLSDVQENRREYVSALPYAHKIKGTVLSIVRESKLRDRGTGAYVWELYKTELEAVDEYVPSGEYAIRAARVVFVGDPYGEGAPEGGPDPDTSETGKFVAGQVTYAQAKAWRAALSNVFPIHVIVPVPTERVAVSDNRPVSADPLVGRLYGFFKEFQPVSEETLEISIQCTAACQSSCQDRCEVLCENSCEATCETSCQAQCEGQCQAICQSFCQSSCESQCQDPCQNFCQSSCQGQCEANCEYGCQQACQEGCQDAGETCQSFCEMNCQTDQEILCSEACEMHCQSSTQKACGDGGCAESCEAQGCQQSCQSAIQACQSVCEVSCEVTEEGGGCESGSCEASCTLRREERGEEGCTLYCEVDCQIACEEQGCQQTCESGCTAGCTLNRENEDPDACFLYCETNCQSQCEARSCQVAGESCAGACEIGCQTPYEIRPQ